MTLVGVISNRLSHGNGGKPRLAALAEGQSDVVFAAPATPAGFTPALAEFARRGVEVLAVDGGDGTVRNVLTALPPDYLPPVALLPSGKTNLVAHAVGSFGSGAAGFQRLLTSARAGWADARLTESPTLDVVWRAEPGLRVRGMLFGAGIFTEATRTGIGLRQLTEGPAVLATLAWAVVHALRRHEAAPHMSVFAQAPCPIAQGPRFLVLATALDRLMLGLWPFPDRGQGGIHWLDVPDPPSGIARALWGAWRGRMGKEFRGGRTDELTVRLQKPFVVDGDLFDPGADGIILRAGPVVRFIGG